MNNYKRLIPAVLLVLVLAAAMLPVTVQAQEPEAANVVTYVPYGETEPHTIHWLRGITPPTMPGQTVAGEVLDLNHADFKLIDGYGKILTPETVQDPAVNPNAEEYYVTEYLPGNGWYDVNKMNESGGQDAELCYVLAATNMMYWWMEQNNSHIDQYAARLTAAGDPLADSLARVRQNSAQVAQNPADSRLYMEVLLPKYRNSGGGWPDLPMDFFFNGYPARDEAERNTPKDYVPTAGGGLFYPVFGRSILTDRRSGGRYEELNRTFREQMDAGIGVILGYTVFGSSAHAVALWGAEYDENDQLCAIYVTDNNDTGRLEGNDRFGPNGSLGADSRLISMIRYRTYNASEPEGRLKITTYKDPRNRGSMINDRFLLTLAEPGWLHYEQTGQPLYADGRAFLSPDLSQIECDHNYVLTAANGRITRTCELCGHQEWVELRQRTPGPYVYNGSAFKPYAMYSSLGGSYPFVPNLTYRDNRDAGTARVSLSYGDVSTSLTFEIQKAPRQAPMQRPVLAEKTATSVTLEAVEGMEYRMDDGIWQAEPVFSHLQPEREYRFTMRLTEQPNYLPSEPSEALTVVTEAGEPEQPAAGLTDAGQSLSLDEEVSINTYVTATGFEEADLLANGGLLIWREPISEKAAVFESETAVVKEGLKRGTVDGKAVYGQQTPGIAAKRYGDPLWLRIYVRMENGEYTYGPLIPYSVRTYCDKAMAGENEALKRTCIQLLQFGAASQTYFAYRMDRLVNSGYEAGESWNEALLTPMDQLPATELSDTGDVRLAGRSLSLDGKIMANVYFRPVDFSVQKAELLLWDAVPGTLTEENAQRMEMTLTDGIYGAQPCGFTARAYEHTVFVCARMTDTDGAVHCSEVLPFSPEGYAALALEKAGNPELHALVRQMVLYGEAARAYLPQ